MHKNNQQIFDVSILSIVNVASSPLICFAAQGLLLVECRLFLGFKTDSLEATFQGHYVAQKKGAGEGSLNVNVCVSCLSRVEIER